MAEDEPVQERYVVDEIVGRDGRSRHRLRDTRTNRIVRVYRFAQVAISDATFLNDHQPGREPSAIAAATTDSSAGPRRRWRSRWPRRA
jgi:hypothetical protein